VQPAVGAHVSHPYKVGKVVAIHGHLCVHAFGGHSPICLVLLIKLGVRLIGETEMSLPTKLRKGYDLSRDRILTSNL
jgi:hypothetical protein